MLSMNPQDFVLRLLMLVPMILSLTVHEFAHAWSAYQLGDDTASRMGRMTLNPIVHIDPIGTILLPLLGIPFGWAKPVPVNPVRFTRKVSMRAGMMITAAAGPFSNLVLAVLCTVAYGLLYRWSPGALFGDSGESALAMLLQVGIGMNVGLAVFNLLPIPPLDGSRVVDGLVPLHLRPMWENFTRYSAFLLLGVIIFGNFLLSGPSLVVHHALGALLRFITT